MTRLPRLVMAAAVSALAISALGVPAAAIADPLPPAEADAKVAIADGIPGTRADVCFNGREIKSGMYYGGKIKRSFAPGDYTIEVFKKDPRKCRGTRLLKDDVTLAADANLTVVLTKKAPKLIVFDNEKYLSSDYYRCLDCSQVTVRNAANVGCVFMAWRDWYLARPAAQKQIELPKSSKGDQAPAGWFRGSYNYAYRWRAVSASGGGNMTASRINFTEPGRMYESILVGTSKRNARFIEIVHRVMPVKPAR